MSGRFKFAVRSGEDGRRHLHFKLQSFSDTHLGTQYAKAKALFKVLQNTATEQTLLLGDIIDLEALKKKESFSFGGPWHKQSLASLLRRADPGAASHLIEKKPLPRPVNMAEGNHELESMFMSARSLADGEIKPYRDPRGKSVYGIAVHDEIRHIDNTGRSILAFHGHRQDKSLYVNDEDGKFFGVVSKRRVYDVLNAAYYSLYNMDREVRKISWLKDISLAFAVKKKFKFALDLVMHVRKRAQEKLDESDSAMGFWGHTHMAEFVWTPGGKLLVNGGCSTEHVQSISMDEDGNVAVLTWYKDRIDVMEAPEGPGRKPVCYSKTFDELGVPEFSLPPSPLPQDDAFVQRAENLLKIIYLSTPAQDQAAVLQERTNRRKLGESFNAAASHEPDAPCGSRCYDDLARYETETRLKLKDMYDHALERIRSMPGPDTSFDPKPGPGLINDYAA